MNADPSWDLYRSFLAVLEEGSLSGAARLLGLTQPTIARHIDTLEAATGCGLFLRSQRGLIATDAALELKPYAQTLAATATALMRTASGHGQTVRGTVRITASEVVGAEHLPPILARLRELHPQLVIELVLSNAVGDLLRGDADIAVRMVEPVQDALVAKRLASIGLGLYAHRSYLARRGVPTSMADLAQHDCIGFDRETPALRAFLQSVPTLNRSSFALRADSDLAQLAAIRCGFGIGGCQIPLAARNPDLVRVLANDFALEMGVWIVMHEDLSTSPRCRAVFDALVEGMSRSIKPDTESSASSPDSPSAAIMPM
ncbi:MULTISPECIES: LysR family transcriptional regulator [unclassified Beijerinckia]|uniref:LysR family transcriptional regulator n=1 Tax=unclassified Beijerinckia TaxID=2638183 RepID=UPI00089463AD|nr:MULTISPECIES: LysR family transcriptional regulator [unclassified Beijerinckia]MDH7798258.1 DNA-binding transcriptional LysR family regulator [Beijerinckia sp. GAS462]SED14710.1 transcriptional regulator, LysR family [Beijerinckia sp. 28-YEA-48]